MFSSNSKRAKKAVIKKSKLKEKNSMVNEKEQQLECTDMDLVLMKHQITNTLLKHTNGFLVSVNDSSEGERYSTGVTMNSLYFDTCVIGGYNSHFHFSNVNEEPTIHDGKEVYSLHCGSSLHIKLEQIKSIQELDEEEKIDVLNLPCKRIFQICMLEGDTVTVGLL